MSDLKSEIALFARARHGTPPEETDIAGLHGALAAAVMGRIAKIWEESRRQHSRRRRAYYFSAEYLMGRMIHNNLLCTGLAERAADALTSMGQELGKMEEIEDAGLGNGGLGRLAACFLDSAATQGLPLDGYGIRYRYGIFRQRLADGFQIEEPDDWTRYGDPWSVRCDADAVAVPFPDGDVRAVPYDMPVIGYGGKHISTLRLWQSEPVVPFDLASFNAQQYDKAVAAKNRAEDISRVLYPNDSTRAGKLLRLRQQYFFTCASLQDLLRRFEVDHGPDWQHLADEIAIQLNDTHPVIAIPELIRQLTARNVPFAQAVAIARQIFRYTNHTVMQEALEKWDMAMVRRVSPAIAGIVRKLATRQKTELRQAGVPEEDWPRLLLLQGDTLHMAYLACWCGCRINGVAQLHTDILKSRVLAAWEQYTPGKIVNVTNGVTPRRWLRLCDPGLAELISSRLGDDRWITDLPRLQRLTADADNEEVLRRFIAVKEQNKQALAAYAAQRDGITIRTDAILDVQVKRLHEYKRQLLNALTILELYFELREGTLTEFTPTVFLFGAKAAPGYYRAKAIIRLIHAVGELIEADERTRALMQVVFVPNYDVSYAEKIVAAADISEQISTAGTEASGTGNMKLMLNGAVTVGTYDGANIEIVREAGEENNFIFGTRVEDIERVRDHYRARGIYELDSRVRRCVDALVDGTLNDGGTGMFRELYGALLDGADWHPADHYFLLADFNDYMETRLRVNREYGRERLTFAAKQWRNLCAAGYFSSDRAVKEYADRIWDIR